jgi:hypothetical protein
MPCFPLFQGWRRALWPVAAGLLLAAASSGAQAATIYKCRAYSGGSFWSAKPCDGRQAAGESVHSVPDGLSFGEQVKLIEGGRTQAASAQKNDEREQERRRKCAAIDDELSRIAIRYRAGQHVPVEQVNADQKREKDLKKLRSENKCHR